MNYEGVKSKVVSPLFAKYGKSVTITRPGVAEGWVKTFSPAHGRYIWTDVDDNVVFTDPATPVVFYGMCVEKRFRENEIDGTNVLRSDVKLLTTTDIDPIAGDLLTVSGVTYRVVFVRRVMPGNTCIIWEVQARE